MTTFQDIFKSSFLENVNSVSLLDMLLALALAFGLGMFIFLVYKKTFSGVMYSSSFGVTLIALTMITTLVILAVTSNIVLSLGMVGALSIVRYRTAVKDPLDVGFLFWTVAVGVTCGAGLYLISILGTVCIAVIYILLVKIRNRKHQYLLIVKYENKASEAVLRELKPLKKVLKNKTSVQETTELTYEVRIHEENTSFVTSLSAVEGVTNAVLLEFTGDYFE